MKIAIIDADLLGRTKHRFPNLACEKISAYWKEKGATVVLSDYSNLEQYDDVYISKVFTDTPVPDWLHEPKDLPANIHIGGTGFYFDKAPNLPYEIEHHMPDYNLYNEWIQQKVIEGKEQAIADNKSFNEKTFMVQFKEYTDYSIGFMTRGCFRKCPFCVNQKYDHVFPHSNLEEFYDLNRKKICLLDDNFLGCSEWRRMLDEILSCKKPFKFKQGIDERLLTDEKCEILFNSVYDGDYTFAFDNIRDYDLIHEKLKLIRKYTNVENIKFYVLVGFESTDGKDIENILKRVALLMKYQCLPYIMRYQSKDDAPWKTSKYRGMYVNIARWCNQPGFYRKKSFREFCQTDQDRHKGNNLCASMRALTDFEDEYPDIAKQYFDLKYSDYTR